LAAPGAGFVNYVIMHQGGQVNELNNNGQVEVMRVDPPGGTAGQQDQGRSQALAAGVQDVAQVFPHFRVKMLRLLGNPRLYGSQVPLNQIKRKNELFLVRHLNGPIA
jgi:hypothetical protein